MRQMKNISIIEAIKARSTKGDHSHWENIPFNLSRLLSCWFGSVNNACLVPNFRMIKAEFIPQTNHKPTRLKLSEAGRADSDKNQSITLNVNLHGEHLNEVAFQVLKKNGFNIISRSSDKNAIYFHCNNWDVDYIELKNIEA